MSSFKDAIKEIVQEYPLEIGQDIRDQAHMITFQFMCALRMMFEPLRYIENMASNQQDIVETQEFVDIKNIVANHIVRKTASE